MQGWRGLATGCGRRKAVRDAQADLLEGKWIGLTIQGDSEAGDSAWVEFVARYKPNSGPATRLHERSRFVREHGLWLYVDGDHPGS